MAEPSLTTSLFIGIWLLILVSIVLAGMVITACKPGMPLRERCWLLVIVALLVFIEWVLLDTFLEDVQRALYTAVS